MSEGSVGNLQEAALKRKEKLQALKERQNKGHLDEQTRNESNETVEKLPRPVFRSYQPQDASLKEAQLPKVAPVEVKEKMKETLENAKMEPVIEEVDLANLAPRKPDWDLKRDIAKKLEKLERRTQRAIAELIRARLQQEGNEDMAAAVATVGVEPMAVETASSITAAAAQADTDYYMDDDDDVV